MIVTVHGFEAYCYTGGKPFDASLPTVVFLHGAQNDHSVWALQTRYVAHHGFGVLAVDLPGHGRSKGAALTTVEAMAAWLVDVLDAAGVTTAILVGHSMGSLIALDTARQAPARVAALALVGTTYPMQVSADLLAMARDDEARAIDMVTIWSHASRPDTPSTYGPGLHVMNHARRLMQRMAAINPAQLFFTDFTACNDYANGAAAAAAVTCPTLFLLGTRDMMTPARSTKMLTASIPHGQVVMIEAGHAMMAEAPDAVLDALLKFVQLA
jgi:pimeloyl-ACP methyl ester carboxylesterase